MQSEGNIPHNHAMKTVFAICQLTPHRLRLVPVGLFVAALTLGGSAAADLKELDTRPDGSRILSLIVHETPRAVPAFRFFDETDNRHGLQKFRGKIVALHFWATWCIPCRTELPMVDALQGELGSTDFTFVSLSVDRNGAALVRKYYDEHGIRNLAVYIDDGMDAAQTLLVNGFPYTIFFNREGLEIARLLGERNWTKPEVIALMRRLIR